MRSILPVTLLVLGLAAPPALAKQPPIPPPETGDVNGDGVADVLMADWRDPPGRVEAGSARVVFGAKGARTALRKARGFRILGASEGERLASDGAYMRSVVGDFNGDGLDDVALGSEASYEGGFDEAGAVYVVFGKRSTKAVDLAQRGTYGIEIIGPSKDARLNSVAGVGDMDGDGLDDIVVGASGAAGEAGAAYVITGRRRRGVIDLETDPVFMTIQGAAVGDEAACEIENAASESPDAGAGCDDGAGWSVAGPGDVNGDRVPDVVVDASRPSVVHGRREGGTVKLDALGTGGYRIEGLSYTTHGVAAAGDVNADGLGDFTVADTGNPYQGASAALLVFGSRSGGGFRYTKPGRRALRLGGEAISPVSGAGDFNGDGHPDLAAGGHVGNRGTAWVAFEARKPGRMKLGAPGWRGLRLSTRNEKRGGVTTPSADPAGGHLRTTPLGRRALQLR